MNRQLIITAAALAAVTVCRPASAQDIDLGITELGEDRGGSKTLVFTVENAGTQTAADVSVAGQITVNFDEAHGRDSAGSRTEITSNGDVVCGRAVPDSEQILDRWTFPITCSVRDLGSLDSEEFRFNFEDANNAVYRLTVTSSGTDSNPLNDTSDGDFLNSPIEFIDTADDTGCATAPTTTRGTGSLLAALVGVLLARRRPRRG